jgi:hypothetical protein
LPNVAVYIRCGAVEQFGPCTSDSNYLLRPPRIRRQYLF